MLNTTDARPLPLDEFLVYLTGSAGVEGRLDEAADCLRDLGATVWAPMGARSPEVDEVDADLRAVFASDVVALLPGWQQDGRVAAVKMFAEAAGVPVVKFEDLLTLG